MNWKIQRLRAEKTKLLYDSEKLLGAIEVAGRDPTPGEKSRLDANAESLKIIGEKLDHEIGLATYAQACTTIQTGGEGGWPGDPRNLDRVDAYGEARKSVVKGAVRKTFKELFPPTGAQSPAMSFDALCQAINTGTFLPAMSAMTEGSGPAGGFSVPEQVTYDIMGASYESSLVLPRCTTYPMTGETLKVAGLDASSAESGTLFGGMTFAWTAEDGSISVTDPTLRKVEFHARKLAILSKASNELNEDSPIGAQIETAMRNGAPWALDYAFFRGTGAGQPRGILNDPALISVAVETAQDADSIVYENLCNMLGRLHPACFNNSAWVCNPSCIPQLLQLSMPIGTGGVQVPVLRESNGGWQIFTRPLLMSEKLPVLGDAGDIILVDLTQYGVALRKDLTIEKSGHVYFTTDETAWRGIVRCDGQGLWKSAYTPRHGSSLSWCVAIAERA